MSKTEVFLFVLEILATIMIFAGMFGLMWVAFALDAALYQ